MRLQESCQICGGTNWCGRPCMMTPPGETGETPLYMTKGKMVLCPECHYEHVESYICNAKYDRLQDAANKTQIAANKRKAYMRGLMRSKRAKEV